MKTTLMAMAVMLGLATASFAAITSGKTEADTPVATYAKLVYANYRDAHAAALALQKAVDAFVAAPSEAGLQKAKEAWLAAREPYGQSEAFRFYEGPIDFADDAKGEEGPESRLNAWPLNEAYIDYVHGDLGAGIIQDTRVEISKQSLKQKNQLNDEADVATGYHAIEFLLWGQDLRRDAPGSRPFSDYEGDDAIAKRRRTYLKAATDLLVDDLAFLVKSWEPGKKNYAATFVAAPQQDALGKILTSLATLSGFELAGERMGTALDSGDQEDEHSCFSDNTHNDFIYNARGIKNVFTGSYGEVKGESVYTLLKTKDATLAQAIMKQLEETEKLIAALPHPVDSEILATPEGSPGRVALEKAIASLQKQADLFVQAGKVLGADVQVVAE